MTALANYGTSGTSPTFEKLRHHFEVVFRSVRIEPVEEIDPLPRNYVVIRKPSAWLVTRISGAARMAVRT